jgi:hypothetical protein
MRSIGLSGRQSKTLLNRSYHFRFLGGLVVELIRFQPLQQKLVLTHPLGLDGKVTFSPSSMEVPSGMLIGFVKCVDSRLLSGVVLLMDHTASMQCQFGQVLFEPRVSREGLFIGGPAVHIVCMVLLCRFLGYHHPVWLPLGFLRR